MDRPAATSTLLQRSGGIVEDDSGAAPVRSAERDRYPLAHMPPDKPKLVRRENRRMTRCFEPHVAAAPCHGARDVVRPVSFSAGGRRWCGLGPRRGSDARRTHRVQRSCRFCSHQARFAASLPAQAAPCQAGPGSTPPPIGNSMTAALGNRFSAGREAAFWPSALPVFCRSARRPDSPDDLAR